MGAAAQVLSLAQAVLRRPTGRVLRPEVVAVQDAQTAAAEVRCLVQAQPLAEPLELPQEAVVRAEQRRAEAEPSVLQLAAEVEAQPGEPPVEAAEVRPSEVRAAAEVLRVEEQAAVGARPSEAQAEAVVQPSAEPVAEQAQLSEVRAARLSAAPSVRSDRPARARLARRRMTAAFRREPAHARTERLRSQSSSAEGVECSSWGLWV